MKNYSTFLILTLFLSLYGCFSARNLTTETQKEQVSFDFTPPLEAPIGSANMTIAIVKPVFVSKNVEYLVSPFPEMATSLGNDFEELLTAKGFTIRGPFNSRDEMVFNEKINSSFILEIQIDLNPQYTVELIRHSKTTMANLLLATEPLAYISYSTKGEITFGGNLLLTALSPQYGEKIWKKNIALEETAFSYEGEKKYEGRPDMADQLISDNKVYNTVSNELEAFYNYALDLVWKQIDPEEMKIVTKQAKEADGRSN